MTLHHVNVRRACSENMTLKTGDGAHYQSLKSMERLTFDIASFLGSYATDRRFCYVDKSHYTREAP